MIRTGLAQKEDALYAEVDWTQDDGHTDHGHTGLGCISDCTY